MDCNKIHDNSNDTAESSYSSSPFMIQSTTEIIDNSIGTTVSKLSAVDCDDKVHVMRPSLDLYSSTIDCDAVLSPSIDCSQVLNEYISTAPNLFQSITKMDDNTGAIVAEMDEIADIDDMAEADIFQILFDDKWWISKEYITFCYIRQFGQETSKLSSDISHSIHYGVEI